MSVQIDKEVSKEVRKESFPKAPSLYRVILLNDDYTPMDFVVMILQKIFQMPLDKAVQVMLSVHHKGTGLCGIYTKDIAETKVSQVISISKQKQHPLYCTMEIHE